jgi:hypothetical protein
MKIDQDKLAEMAEIVSALDLRMLALAARHEYDDDAVVPPEGSPGAAFLRDGRDRFVEWLRREGRFPTRTEAETEAVATWHHAEGTPAQRAQAFVDLGLFFTPYATTVRDASMVSLNTVLDRVAEELALTLLDDYGPREAPF